MASAEEYLEEVTNQMGLADMTIRASSLTEAKAGLGNVRGLQKQLRQVKRKINLDMKTIRADYRQRMSQPAAASSSLATIFGKRKLAGQLRADAKRGLRAERDRKLAPYDEVKLMIDDLLVQLEAGKAQLQDYVEQAKAQQQSEEQAPEPVCRRCGGSTASSDAFCRWCGHRLGSA